MKTSVTIVRFLLPLLLVAGLLFGSVTPARADSFDDFVNIYAKIESYMYPEKLPVSAQMLRDSKALFTCIEQGRDTLVCIDEFSHTTAGKQVITDGVGLPSYFYSLLDAYVAYKNGDYWGVAYSLGETAVCAVMHVLTGGTADICGIIKQLVELAESLWDAATAVAEFFADLGEGAWEAAKGAYCDTLGTVLGGCDDDNSPPEVVAYAWVFAPRLSDGLIARKSVDPQAFDLVLQQLIKQASANPAQLNISVPPMIADIISFPAGAVTTAAGIYTNTVDQNWTADILDKVLPALGQQWNSYGTDAKIAQLATTAATAFKNTQADPAWVVTKQCSDEFRQSLGFAHVDRWIVYPPTAPTAQKFKVTSTQKWCGGTFWDSNQEKFANNFATFARTNFCPGTGSTFPCKTIENYERCRKLMGSVGREKLCGVDINGMGKEAAEKVKQSLLDQGSKGYYSVVAAPVGKNVPAQLICQRPPQQKACTETYQKLFGSYPATLVACTVQEPADYAALRQKVAQAVATLNGTQALKNLTSAPVLDFNIDPVDPLLVWPTSGEAYVKVRDENPSFGFGPPSSQPGFAFPLLKQHVTLDGLDTPAISSEFELKRPKPQKKTTIQEKLGPKKPGDPIDQLKLQQQMTRNVAPMAAQNLAKGGLAGAPAQQQQVMSGKLPAGKAPNATPAKAMASSLTPAMGPQPAGVAIPARQTVLPAKLVPGNVPAAVAKGTPPVPAAKPATLQLADLTAAQQLTIGGKAASWQTPLMVEARDAQQKINGICQYSLQYTLRNAGVAASIGFVASWSNAAVPGVADRPWPTIASGASSSQTDVIGLKPGVNQLTLTIDKNNQVKETDENNNLFRLTVTVNGPCSDGAMRAPALPIKR